MPLWPLHSRSSSQSSDIAPLPGTNGVGARTPGPRNNNGIRRPGAPAGGLSKAAFSTPNRSNGYAASADRVRALQGPPSPTLSARSSRTNASNATRGSRMEWAEAHAGPDVIITRADMRNSLDTYERLLNAAKVYRNAMLALATATSNFASALEDCARQKGANQTKQQRQQPPNLGHTVLVDDLDGKDSASKHEDMAEDEQESAAASERLMAAAGLHHVMSNQQQLLSDTFYKAFEIPLLEKYDHYKAEVADRQLTYEKDTELRTKQIRDTESENMRIGRKKQRDLASFRKALMQLQMHVEDLDRVKADYYYEVLDGEQETWDMVAGKVALVVRSQIDSADRIVTKSTSDAMIEGMVQTILDPFNAYQQPDQGGEGHIFSVLQPLSIASSSHTSPKHPPSHPVASLARSRTSTSPQVDMSQNNAPQNSSNAQATYKWAEEQQDLATNAAQPDSDVTPRRRLGKDQLSWMSNEHDSGSRSGAHHDSPSKQDFNDEAARRTIPASASGTESPSDIPGLDEDSARWA